MLIRTDNPIADAEAYQIEPRRKIGECEICGCGIYAGNDEYYADEYYEIDGHIICDEYDCLRTLARREFRGRTW